VLAGGIAHDFNNLLVGVLGNASLAMGQVPPDAPVRVSLEQIAAAAQRAAVLVDQMLAYAGRGASAKQTVRLPEIVAEMAHLLEASISKAISLEYDFAEDVPPVAGDVGQLQQVAMNLITNAAEAMEEAGVVHIRVSTVPAALVTAASGLVVTAPVVDGDYVCLTVEDSGGGMDEQTRDRIFEPFFTTKFTGRGLGLAAVIGIVRDHHGSLAVDTALGQGTRFSVFLPALSPGSIPAEVAHEHQPVPTTGVGGTILVADDEELVRSLAERVLADRGFTVITACDGAEAIALVRDHPIDLVVLDLTMPRVGGVEALAAIGELRPELPVILSSGYSERDAQEQVGSETVAAFIQKPYLPERLVAAVTQILGGK